MSTDVLVTGGTGFLGSHLVPTLLADGYRIDVVSREPQKSELGSLSVTIHSGDVRDAESLPSFGPYDTIIHLAGLVSVSKALEAPTETIRTNTLGTQNVLERARQDNVDEFLYVSSASVYGNPEYLPIDETHPTAPPHPYAASKVAGEEILQAYTRAYGLSAVTARVFNLYGPGQRADTLVGTLLSQVSQGNDELSLGNLDPSRDFVYVDDVVRGIRILLSTLEGGYDVFNIGSGTETTVRELTEAFISAVDPDLQITENEPGRDESVEVERMCADVTNLRRLGWEPSYDIESGMRKLLEGSDNVGPRS